MKNRRVWFSFHIIRKSTDIWKETEFDSRWILQIKRIIFWMVKILFNASVLYSDFNVNLRYAFFECGILDWAVVDLFRLGNLLRSTYHPNIRIIFQRSNKIEKKNLVHSNTITILSLNIQLLCYKQYHYDNCPGLTKFE